MEIRGQDNRGRAAENPNGKSALMARRFKFQYLGLNECEMRPESTTAPADVVILFIPAVARVVLVHQFRLSGASAVRAVNARVIHLCLPLLGDLLCCLHCLTSIDDVFTKVLIISRVQCSADVKSACVIVIDYFPVAMIVVESFSVHLSHLLALL
jgi:hypothetical protein